MIYDWKDGRGPDGIKMDRGAGLFARWRTESDVPPYERPRIQRWSLRAFARRETAGFCSGSQGRGDELRFWRPGLEDTLHHGGRNLVDNSGDHSRMDSLRKVEA